MDSKDFICFGGEDWWYHNRGHIDMQLMRRFAKQGITVYVNSIVMQKPSLKRKSNEGVGLFAKIVRKTRSILRGLKKSDSGFWVYSPFSLPVHHIAWLRPVNRLLLQFQIWVLQKKLKIKNPIVWVACPAACDVAIRMKKSKLVYQRTDRFEEFPSVDSKIIKLYDQTLKAKSDLTIFVNDTLFDQESSQCKKAIYLDHGVDYELFASAEKNNELPSDMTDIPKPIVGFFGAFGKHTTDISLLGKVADLLPELSFVFVGPTIAECDSLSPRNNVWLLGQKPYEQIPHYGKCFDVALMPWKQNRWIAACNPIKLKEYLALGKPVVSTPFNELSKYIDVIYKADTPDLFAKCITKALKEDCSERKTARRKKIEKFSWNSKAQFVLKELAVTNNIIEKLK